MPEVTQPTSGDRTRTHTYHWPWYVGNPGYFGDRYEDVKYERLDGWLSGFLWGVVVSTVAFCVVLAMVG